MNKKFFIAWLVIFIAWMAGDFVIHGLLLDPDYKQLAKLYRTEARTRGLLPLDVTGARAKRWRVYLDLCAG